ncbi:MAG: class I SAM-dependent methyltransferase [Gemmatimonadota bacterium]
MPDAREGDSTTRFSDRVDHYVRSRPRYPPGVLRILEEETGLRPSWEVADFGSGTGISAELFVANGNRVFAVEPNAAMRAAAEVRFRGDDRFVSVAGTAEETGLAPGSVDLVVAAQAFHWFDTRKARVHFARILREPRWVALLWNRRRLRATPFLAAYEDLLLEFGTDYQAVRHDAAGYRDPIDAFYGGRYRRRELSNEQVLDRQGLVGRLLSSSYTPAAGHPDREPMLARLGEIFERYQSDGTVVMEYDTELFVGRLA